MLIEMLPDMLEDVLAWKRKSYQQHFADSEFKDRNLAVEAYGRAPERVLSQFEALVACLDGHLWKTQNRLRDLDQETPSEVLADDIATTVEKLHRLIGMISCVVNGSGAEVTAEEVAAPRLVDAAEGVRFAEPVGEEGGGIGRPVRRIALDHHDQRLVEIGEGRLEGLLPDPERKLRRQHVLGRGVDGEMADGVGPRQSGDDRRQDQDQPGVARDQAAGHLEKRPSAAHGRAGRRPLHPADKRPI